MSETISGSGMVQYIKNNKEALTAQSYSPEDALVFSQLAYMKFEKVYGSDYNGEPVSVKKFANDLLQKEIETDKNETSFLKELSKSERYSACEISQMAAENEKSQWAAMTIHMNDASGSSVIAMRGTNGTELGWTEDLELLYDKDGTEAQKYAASYLQNSPENHIYLTGHSKGGNDVSSAYVMSDEATRSRVVQIDNFDGPGVNEKFRDAYAEGYAQLADKQNNYYPQDSVIGLLLDDNPGKTYYVKSSKEDGFFHEHDPFNWQFDGKSGFQYTEQSWLSDFVNEVTDNAVSTLSQRERVLLVGLAVNLGIPAGIAEERWPPKDMSVCEQIGKAALLYLDLRAGGGVVFAKTVSAMITFGAIKAGKILAETAYKFVMQEILDFYTQVAEYLNNLKKAMADAVRSFIDDLKDAVDDLADAVADFFRREKNRKGSGAGSFGRADFFVEPGTLARCENQMDSCRELIHGSRTKILFVMGKLALCSDFASICNLERLAAQLEQEEKSCKKLANTLKKIGKQYQKSEQILLDGSR